MHQEGYKLEIARLKTEVNKLQAFIENLQIQMQIL
jgi:hypothetical protein